MNDITALAQREKFEAWAEEAGALPWGRLKKQRNTSGGYSLQVYTYMWTAWQAASAEMVEALEAEQQKSAKQGRHACELFDEVKQLQEQLRTVELSNSVLESRTVTVKLPNPLMPAQHNSGELFMTPDNVIHGGYLNRDDVLRNLRAAGIQVIEGEGQ